MSIALDAGPRLHREQVGGATVVTLEEHSLPVVRFVVATRNGALADPQGASGTMRLLFEMLLRGTTTRDRVAFNAELERLGSSLHALTGTYSCALRGVTLRRNLDATFELVLDALTAPALAEEELAPLIEESRESLRAERDDDDHLAEIFLRRALYAGHALERSPGGTMAELAGIDGAQLRAAHAQRVGADDLILLFGGDITPEEARRVADPLLAALPTGKGDVVAPPPPPAQPQGLQILLVDKPERSQAQLRLARTVLDGKHPDIFACWLGVIAFGGTFTSPFSHQVREVRGWSYVAYAELDRRGLLPAPLVMRSAPALSDAVDCLALELDMYRELARGTLAPDVVEAARSYLLNHYPLQVATVADLMPPVLRDELLGVSPEEIFAVPQRLAALEPAGIGAMLQRHLSPEDLVVTVVATASEVEPALRERFPEATLSTVPFRDGLEDSGGRA